MWVLRPVTGSDSLILIGLAGSPCHEGGGDLRPRAPPNSKAGTPVNAACAAATITT